jgi:hypothetical protein
MAPGCGLDVLGRLDVPSLTDIRLDGWRPGGCLDGWGDRIEWSDTLLDCMHDAFTGLSSRSRRLQRINLRAIKMREHDYRCLYQDFPELKWLRLIVSNITDQAFVGAT